MGYVKYWNFERVIAKAQARTTILKIDEKQMEQTNTEGKNRALCLLYSCSPPLSQFFRQPNMRSVYMTFSERNVIFASEKKMTKLSIGWFY